MGLGVRRAAARASPKLALAPVGLGPTSQAGTVRRNIDFLHWFVICSPGPPAVGLAQSRNKIGVFYEKVHI
jgi:hypothetical protein